MSSGQHVGHARRPMRFVLALLVVAALVVAGLAYFRAMPVLALGADGAAPSPVADQCVVQTVEIVAAPDVSTAVRAGAATMQDQCLTIRVTPRPTADVTEEVLAGQRLPAVWVPDSASWQDELFLAGIGYRQVSDAFASSPVVLVGGPAARSSASWGDALASGQVALPDPLSTTVGAMTLVAPRAEGAGLGRSDADSDQLAVPLAQEYGERRSNGEAENLDLASLGTTQRLVPVSERAYLAALERSPGLVPAEPATGAPLMRFPLVLPAQPTDIARTIATGLKRWIATAQGRSALEEIGLRRGDGTPLRTVPALEDLTFLPTPEPSVFGDRLHSWQITSVPSSLLAVFDVSGSMDFPAGDGQTRMELSVGWPAPRWACSPTTRASACGRSPSVRAGATATGASWSRSGASTRGCPAPASARPCSARPTPCSA